MLSLLTVVFTVTGLSLGVTGAAAQDAEEPPVVHDRCYEQSTIYPVAAAAVRSEMPPGFQPAPAPSPFPPPEGAGDESALLVALATDCITSGSPGARSARSLYYGVSVDPPDDQEIPGQQHILLLRGYTDHAKFARHARRWCFGHVLAPGTVQWSVTRLPNARIGTARASNSDGSIAMQTSVPDSGTTNPSPEDQHTLRFFAARDGALVGIMDAAFTPAVFIGPGEASLLVDGDPFSPSQPPALAGAAIHIFPDLEANRTSAMAFSSTSRC